MKDLLNKIAKGSRVIIALSLIAVFFLSVAATGFVISNYERVQSPAGWVFLKYSATFAVATDTNYFLINAGQRDIGNIHDTLSAFIQTQIRPLSDTSNVQWEVWSSSDTSGWRLGTVFMKNGMWSKYTVARDSAASGIVSRVIYVGPSNGGDQPFICLVGIGKSALSNGKGNEVGNVLRAYVQTR